jgi:putative transcriptional regulator
MVGKSEGGLSMKESRKRTELGSSGQSGASARDKARDWRSNSQNAQSEYLDGQMLIAMPVMDDERFQRSVIYMCAHSSEGAMGIIVNRPAGSIDFPGLLLQLDIIKQGDRITLPKSAEAMKVLRGGPVEPGRGFVLHSSDFFIKDSTLAIDEDVSLTATLDILKAIATGAGPSRALLALGYAGWAPGQLENEIQHNGWLHCAADSDLVFDRDVDSKYERALKKIGIDLAMLSNEAGHA